MKMDKCWINTFRDEIHSFTGKIEAFDHQELARGDYKGFSGGLGSYAQRDPSRHMLRLRMPGGRLTKARLAFVAKAVEEQKISLLKLTTCETIQLHNLTAAQVPVLMEQAIECDIYSRGGGGDNPRNTMASPLSGVQPGEAFDVLPYAEATTQYLLSICRDIKMPRKLKIAFCNGVDDRVHSAFRDMGFLAQPDGTFALNIAGGLGANHRMGVRVADGIPAGEILYYVRAMVDVFCAHGNYTNRAKARTRYLQETLGDSLKDVYLAAVAARKAEGGLGLAITPAPIEKAGDGDISHPRAIPQKQPGLYAVAYHPLGGCIPADKPAALYAAIKDMPAVECRIAPDETIYIINLTASEAGKVLAITADSAASAFESSVACIGAAICQQGVRDSQAVLRAAAEAVRAAGLPDGALPRCCFSGCPSSCSAHQSAPIGFQGFAKPVDGKPQPAFRVFLGGEDTLGEACFGEPVATVLESDIPAFLVELGRGPAAAEQTWAEWAPANETAIRSIIETFN